MVSATGKTVQIASVQTGTATYDDWDQFAIRYQVTGDGDVRMDGLSVQIRCTVHLEMNKSLARESKAFGD